MITHNENNIVMIDVLSKKWHIHPIHFSVSMQPSVQTNVDLLQASSIGTRERIDRKTKTL